jgi:hypothetical protein
MNTHQQVWGAWRFGRVGVPPATPSLDWSCGSSCPASTLATSLTTPCPPTPRHRADRGWQWSPHAPAAKCGHQAPGEPWSTPHVCPTLHICRASDWVTKLLLLSGGEGWLYVPVTLVPTLHQQSEMPAHCCSMMHVQQHIACALSSHH